LEYRSLKPPRPERKIIAVWPKQRPPNRAALALLKGMGSVLEK
jgi:LysR family hydrogen peroxide-inducible transcriptional activator